jgi:hypothetical protein
VLFGCCSFLAAVLKGEVAALVVRVFRKSLASLLVVVAAGPLFLLRGRLRALLTMVSGSYSRRLRLGRPILRVLLYWEEQTLSVEVKVTYEA